MYTQLRTYTVNRGTMDPWIEFWRNNVKLSGEACGQLIRGPWINEAATEFIWLRIYASADDAKVKDAAFAEHPHWKAVRPQSQQFIAKSEVVPLLAPTPFEVPLQLLPYAQLRVYTINRGGMDAYLDIFRTKIMPVHASHGIAMIGPWVNEQRTRIYWVRHYASAEEAKQKEEALYGSAAWKVVLPQASPYVAHAEIKVMTHPLVPAAA